MENYIIPGPQELEFSGAFFQVDKDTVIVIDPKVPASILPAATVVAETISQSAGIIVPIVKKVYDPDAKNCISITESPQDFKSLKNWSEAYSIDINQGGIFLTGASARGIFYGLQTLAQIMRHGNAGKVEGLKIRDWPDFELRGAHVCFQFYGPVNVPFFKRLIKACAANKLNTLEIGLDDMLVYDSYPGIAAAGAFTKKEMKGLIDYAAEYFVKIIPVIQSLGHVNHSVFSKFPEVLEVSGANTYCPNNPKVYKILFDILDEVIELFDPPYITMGHDEVDTLGKCEKCRKSTPHELFAGDVKKIRDYLASKGVKMVIFGDMLLDPSWTRPDQFSGYFKGGAPLYVSKALELIPKDVIIADWHYDRDPRYVREGDYYPSVARFKEAGLDVHPYCSWYRLSNSYCFSKCALKNNLPGLIVTTWGPLTLTLPKVGSDTTQRLKYNPEALKGIERAAEYFWTVGRPDVARTDEMGNDFFWRELDYAIRDPGEEM